MPAYHPFVMAKFIHYDKVDVARSTFVVAENEVTLNS
jgi:hypothetical protein